VPFLAEVMWKNLRTKADVESVHLCDYPVPDESLVDAALSQDVDALLRLVSLGGAARNAAKQKVRQPLAELRVQPGSDAEGRAVDRFAGQITEELNVKRVTLHDLKAGPMLKATAKLNKKTANAKLGAKGKEAEGLLAALDAAKVAEQLRAGAFTLADVPLDSADVVIEYVAPEGWAGVADKGTQVMIDARITDELKAEGLAREVVRFVQDTRKDAGLDVADKIVLFPETTSDKLKQAIAAHQATIAAETQAGEWAAGPFAGAHTATVKVEGQELTIHLRKV
jgi:isoleucyl-tRNA synthetase